MPNNITLDEDALAAVGEAGAGWVTETMCDKLVAQAGEALTLEALVHTLAGALAMVADTSPWQFGPTFRTVCYACRQQKPDHAKDCYWVQAGEARAQYRAWKDGKGEA